MSGLTPSRLDAQDIRAELERLYRKGPKAHRSTYIAFFGTGEPGEVGATLGRERVRFRIAPVRCELEAREALMDAEDGTAPGPTVLLVDYAQDLPLDVKARLASERVFFVDRDRRLRNRFGATSVAVQVLASPVAKALLEDPAPRPGEPGWTVRGPQLDLETAWRAFVARHGGLPPEGDLGEARVLEHCVRTAAGDKPAAFAARVARQEGLGDEWREWLTKRVGPVAAQVWAAWQAGGGLDAAAVTVLLGEAGAAVGESAALRVQVGEAARRAGLSEVAQAFGSVASAVATAERWKRAAEGLWLRLSGDGDAEVGAELLRRAGALVTDEEARAALGESRRLGPGWDAACDALARVLDGAVGGEAVEAAGYEAAREALTRLGLHRRAETREGRLLVARAEAAVKLVGWLVERDDPEAGLATAGAREGMESAAEAYAQAGGFVDLARRRARGDGGGALELAVGRVVALADAARDADDRRFAAGLQGWVAAGRPSARVVPIHHGLKRFGAELLKGAAGRRLLVAIVDGMAWANAVALAEDLETQLRMGPIAWRPNKATASRPRLPMLADLPTVTDVSRAALCAGKPYEAKSARSTGQDPARFASHRELDALESPGGGPELLLSKDAVTPDGGLSERARELVHGDRRVVGVVLNGIDDQLSASREVRVAWSLDTFRPFAALMSAARDAGRVVLLTSDHGHVTSDRVERARPEAGAGERHRFLAKGEAPAEGEVRVESDSVPRGPAPGRGPLVMLVSEQDRYSGKRVEGAHGGAALAEVVAPAVLLAHSDLAEQSDDAALAVRPFPKPWWWLLVKRGTVGRASVEDAPIVEKRRQAPEAQLDLLAPSPPPEPVAKAPKRGSDKRPLGPVGKRVMASDYFAYRTAKERKAFEADRAWLLDVLADHGWRLTAEQMAQHAGVVAYRVPGLVSQMSEWLNVDGFEVIRAEADGSVVLDEETLNQLFEEVPS